MRKLCQLFLVPVVAGFLLGAGAGCSKQAKKIYHLKRADRYFVSGQYNSAEIEYINVLRNDPANAQAISRLGIIYFDEGRLQRAAPLLFSASQIDTNNLEIRLKLGSVYLVVGKAKEAREEAGFILDRKPQDEEAPLLLVRASTTANEIEEARQRLKKLSQNKETAPFELALGTISLQEGDLKTAEAAFKRAQALDPKSSAAYAALGNLYWAQNDLKQAEPALKSAADLSPPRSPRKLQYARFKMQTGDPAAAAVLLDEIVKKTPDYIPAWIQLAEIAAAGKKYSDSAVFLEKVLALDPDDFDALLLNGRLLLAEGDTAKSIGISERLAAAYPQSPRVQYQLALGYLVNNEVRKGVNCLNKAVGLDPNFADAILLLAEVQIKSGSADTAAASLKQLTRKQPQLTQAQLLLADACRAQGNFGEALAIYESLKKSFPQNPQVPLLEGSTFVQQEKNEQARVEFNRALEISTNTLPAVQQLVNLDLMEKRYAGALQLIQKEISKKPEEAELRLLQARVFLAQGDNAQAEAALEKVTELKPEGDTAYLLLAELYTDSKENGKALANLKLAVGKNPNDIAGWMALGVFQNDAKNYSAAADAYEKLLAINPKFGPALNNLAYLYSENLNQLERAYELAQKARELYPNNPSAADTLGWVLCKKRLYQSALGLLLESADKMPGEPEIQFHLGVANYMMGQEDAARAAFQRALDLHKDFPAKDECNLCLSLLAIDPKTAGPGERATLEKRMVDRPEDPVALARLGAVYQRAGESGKAIELYETSLKANPKNVKATMILIQLYPPKDAQKAFDLARAAYKSWPDEPGLSYTLGRLAYQTGNYKFSFGLLQDAVRNRPGDPMAQYDFALAAYSLGKISDAAAATRSALQSGLSPARSDQAALLLDMISLAADPVQAATASARVAGILKTNSDYVPALMATAVINEQNTNVAGAQQSYEKILAAYPDFAPAQRGLAILYATDPGKTGRAYELATKARDDFPNDPALTKALGIILFQQGDYSHAVNLLKAVTAERNTDAELFYYLGSAQYHLKNGAESKLSLQRALELNLSGDQAVETKRILAELR